jgi:hypothetical protein
MPVSRYIDSGLRHLFAFMEGKADEDHLIAACWNLLCAVDTESRIHENVLPKELLDIGPTVPPPAPNTPPPASKALPISSVRLS